MKGSTVATCLLFIATALPAQADGIVHDWIDALAQQNTQTFNELFSKCKTNHQAHGRLSPVYLTYSNGNSVPIVPTSIVKSEEPDKYILFFIDGSGPQSRMFKPGKNGNAQIIGLDRITYNVKVSTASSRLLSQIRFDDPDKARTLYFPTKTDDRSPECFLSGQNQRWQNNANLEMRNASATTAM